MAFSVRRASMACPFAMRASTLTLGTRRYSTVSGAASSALARAEHHHTQPSLLDRSVKRLQISCASFIPQSSSSNYTPIVLLLLSSIGMAMLTHELAEENGARDPQLTRINTLLEKQPKSRTTEEKIELYNYLVKKGREEVLKGKGKDVVVVIGDTGAGKSALIDFIFGCTMTKNNKGQVLVDPNSKVKEVAKIGTGFTSETFIPKVMTDFTITTKEFELEEEYNLTLQKQHLTFIDMAGFTDSRGIEVALGGADLMGLILENAKSVRFVLVFEHAHMKSVRYAKLHETSRLLEERFNNAVGRGENSLCVVITQEPKDQTADMIKAEMKEAANKVNPGAIDLSKYVSVYNPLNPNDRKKVLSNIVKCEAHEKLDAKVSMGGNELFEALKLGEEIGDSIGVHLKKGGIAEVNKAVNKIQFTHGIERLGNADLIKPHMAASQAVYQYAKHVSREIDPKHKNSLPRQIEAFKDYMSVKNSFAPYVNFEDQDQVLKLMIEKVPDPRSIAWDKPHATALSFLGAAACGAGAYFLPPYWVTVYGVAFQPLQVGAVAAGSAGMYTMYRWQNSSDEEKDMSFFFDGPTANKN
jgi:hypothetical protein